MSVRSTRSARAARAALALTALGAVTLLTGCSILSMLGGAGDATRDESGEVIEGNDAADAFNVRVGDCIEWAESTEFTTIPIVACSEPHDAQAYHSELLPEGEFPGAEAIETAAIDACEANFAEFAGISYLDTRELDFSWLNPTESSWAAGDREILCLIVEVDPETYEPISTIGSLEGAAR